MRRVAAVALCLAAVTAVGAGTMFHQETQKRPGIVTAESVLYDLDVAADNALVRLGLVSAGEVAHERASEALVAAEAGDDAARDRALTELNRVAEIASSNDTEGLVKARSLLEEIRDRSPLDANTGVGVALDAVNTAIDREPMNNEAE